MGNIYADRLGAERAGRLQPHLEINARKEKKPFTGALMIRAARSDAAQRLVESLLDDHVKRWKLAEVVPSDGGTSVLEYLVRSKDAGVGTALVAALTARGGPDILSVEFRSLEGLKQGDRS